MKELNALRGEIPASVLEVRVAGMNNVYYELADGSFLVLAGIGGQHPISVARKNLAAHDAETLTKWFQEKPEDFKTLSGIPAATCLISVPAPAAKADPLSIEEAIALNDETFEPFREGAELPQPPVVEEEEDEAGDDGDGDQAGGGERPVGDSDQAEALS
jgi:hypothetical protein